MDKDEQLKIILDVTVMGAWGADAIGTSRVSIAVPKRFIYQSKNLLYDVLDYLLVDAEAKFLLDKNRKNEDN